MSRPKFFRKVFDGTRTGQALQSNIEEAIASVLKSQLLDGRLIETAQLSSGGNAIEHRLDRKLKGYIVVKTDAAVSTYVTSDDEKFLNLNASADATVSLWVF